VASSGRFRSPRQSKPAHEQIVPDPTRDKTNVPNGRFAPNARCLKFVRRLVIWSNRRTGNETSFGYGRHHNDHLYGDGCDLAHHRPTSIGGILAAALIVILIVWLLRSAGCVGAFLRPGTLTENVPRVAGPDRIKATDLGSGFWQIEAHFGFAQTPNILRELGRAKISGFELDPNQLSFFAGRTNVKPSSRPGMARWRERLYSSLARIATRPTEFFRIPPDRVIELGAEVEI
jgi:hypothetical protein